MADFYEIWRQLVLPLARLLFGLSFGLLLASVLEHSGWVERLAKFAAPLGRFARLGAPARSSFALAFASSHAANALLSESFKKGDLSLPELFIANLFNTLPAWFIHFPTIFLLLLPVLGEAAFVYSGLTLLAAAGRMLFAACIGRLVLKTPDEKAESVPERKAPFSLREIIASAFKAFRRRFPRLLFFTIPFYTLMFAGQKTGLFGAMESWLAARLDWLSILKPQAISIAALQIIAEMGAALGAAAAALQDGALSTRDIVAALLVGNILAAPLRTIRHQLPAYAAYYPPVLALKLIVSAQGARIASLVVVIAVYTWN